MAGDGSGKMLGAHRPAKASAVLSVVASAVVGLALCATPAHAVGENASATGLIFNGGRTAPADCPPGGGANAPGGPFGLVTVGALTASCTDTGAQASAASVDVGTLHLGLVQSQCTTGPAGTASSSVAVISGGGALDNTVVSNPATIDLGFAQVFLNEVVNEPGFRTVNAVRVVLVGQEIIIAQSRCSTVAYPLSAQAAQVAAAEQLPKAVGSSAPVWLVVSAALALLIAVKVVLVGGFSRRHRADTA